MGVVSGAISIKDNATAVLRAIKQEQSSFRADVEKTKKTLTSTWEKQYKAKLEATPAMKKANELKTKLEPLRKKVVTATALKDMASDKIKKVKDKVKQVGGMIAKPVVNVVVKGAQALSAVGKGIMGAAKVAAVGIGAVAAIGGAALKALYNGSEEAAKAQIEAETKLEAVLGNVKSIQEQGAGAAQQAKERLMGVASELQQVGVIGDEVTLAGMQQLATFQLSEKEISTLAGGMTDLLAQQKGLNATQEDAVGIGNMIGKVMQGQTSALSRVGITFDEAQEKALKMGTAEERAAVLAEILQQNVGGVNQALAETDQGKIQQMSNAYGDMKEEVGKLVLTMKAKFAGVIMKNIPLLQKMGTTMMSTISSFADKAMPMIESVISTIVPQVESVLGGIGDIADEITPLISDMFSGMQENAKVVLPVLKRILDGFKPLIPQLVNFGTSVYSTIQQITVAAMPAIERIITTVQNVLPAVLPVLQTVIATIGNVISQAAPIIAGMVEGIGGVVTTLAPIFQRIFSEIGEKVGTVIGFVSERMGFIQGVFETVAPLLGDILSTAWGVISPIMDIAVTTFELIFSVVQKVFPGIQAIVETVWGILKPILEGIGGALEKLASGWDWLVSKVTGTSVKGGGGEVGTNATGDNNWKGGLTWVGEEGAELVDLPKGSRILPNKESVSLAQGRETTSAHEMVKNSVTKNVIMSGRSEEDSGTLSVLQSIERGIGVIATHFLRSQERAPSDELSLPWRSIWGTSNTLPVPNDNAGKATTGEWLAKAVTITIAKLADSIIVREDADIEKISNAVAKKVVEVAANMA